MNYLSKIFSLAVVSSFWTFPLQALELQGDYCLVTARKIDNTTFELYVPQAHLSEITKELEIVSVDCSIDSDSVEQQQPLF